MRCGTAPLLVLGLLFAIIQCNVGAVYVIDFRAGGSGDGSVDNPFHSFDALDQVSFAHDETVVLDVVGGTSYVVRDPVPGQSLVIAGTPEGTDERPVLTVLFALAGETVHLSDVSISSVATGSVIQGDTVILTRTNVSAGHTDSLGGCVHIGPGGFGLIEDVTFTGCSATRGGALAALSEAVLTVRRSVFTNNVATLDGSAAALINVARVTFEECVFSTLSNSGSTERWIVTFGDESHVALVESIFNGPTQGEIRVSV